MCLSRWHKQCGLSTSRREGVRATLCTRFGEPVARSIIRTDPTSSGDGAECRMIRSTRLSLLPAESESNPGKAFAIVWASVCCETLSVGRCGQSLKVGFKH